MHAKSCKDEQNLGGEFFLNVFKPTSGHLRSIAVAIQCNMRLVFCYNCCARAIFFSWKEYCIIYSSKLGNKMCSEVHKYNAVTVVLCVNLFHVCVRLFFQQLTLHAMCYTQP